MKSGKQHMTDVMELPNQKKCLPIGEKETYKFLEIFLADTIKRMKDEFFKKYLRITRKLL